MKFAVLVTCLLLSAGCGSVRPQKAEAPTQRAIVMLKYLVEGVTFTDGVNQVEAELISVNYFPRVVGGCGMPDKPEDRGVFWCIQLWGGIVGSDYGQLWVAKDGNSILLEPPWNGFRPPTKMLLKRQGVAYE